MVKFLDCGSSESEDGGVQIKEGSDFKINQDYARKFTHNKKREELRRLEDKFGPNTLKRKRPGGEDGNSSVSSTDSSSESEEDDAGELATEVLDSEINATLNAIRSKDPRVYDEKTTFYSNFDVEQEERPAQEKKAKPMYLRDYHRENLLNGNATVEGGDDEVPLTYNQEQEALKKSVLSEIHAAAANGVANEPVDQDEEASNDDFLVTKKRKPEPKSSRIDALDVKHADKDPETFLSNFMASRAWVPLGQSALQPFESDESDEDRRAEEFEEAYNFRFEDPAKANEKLTSHARDVAARNSVRRENENVRKKARAAEKQRRESAQQELAEEKARLRRLRIEDVQEKLRKIKRAAGLRGKDLQDEDWASFLDESWDDAKWEEQMRKRFGDIYYNDKDGDSDEEPAGIQVAMKKRKLKKPKWDDEIDIGDIVPDFEDDQPAFSRSESEAAQPDIDEPQSNNNITSQKTSKEYKKERQYSKKEARKERKIIEELVDKRLEIDTALMGGPSKRTGFRYRETSPVSYGLSAREILLAPDSKLNEFVGLKRLAAFRDPEKKRKDQKHFGKKARLRKWRQETFGDEDGLNNANLVQAREHHADANDNATEAPAGVDIRGDGRKKKRRRKAGTSKPNDPVAA